MVIKVLTEKIPLHTRKIPLDGHAICRKQKRERLKDKYCAKTVRYFTRFEISIE